MAAGNGKTTTFNIKAVAVETGLKPVTIRAWERRYGVPEPQRTDGGHRQYTRRDIEVLKWLVARQAEGVSISHAVTMWQNLIKQGQDPLRSQQTAAARAANPTKPVQAGSRLDQLRSAWTAACMAYDRSTAEQVLERAFSLFTAETVCLEVLQKGLVQIGQEWFQGRVTVQQEHFASALTIRRLEILISATPPPTRPGTIIICAAPGDNHIFSPLLLTLFLRRQGWDVVYLGANIPVHELEDTISKVNPRLVIVSAQQLPTAANLLEVAHLLQSHSVRMAFGGLIFNQTPALRRLIPGHYLGETLAGVPQMVNSLLAQPRQIPAVALATDDYRRALEHFQVRRSLIESHVWGSFLAANRPLDRLGHINTELGNHITAALKLGDITLLPTDAAWLETILISFRLPTQIIGEYATAYRQAAHNHLEEPAAIILDWLDQLVKNITQTPGSSADSSINSDEQMAR